jgi:hypothetical protein
MLGKCLIEAAGKVAAATDGEPVSLLLISIYHLLPLTFPCSFIFRLLPEEVDLPGHTTTTTKDRLYTALCSQSTFINSFFAWQADIGPGSTRAIQIGSTLQVAAF